MIAQHWENYTENWVIRCQQRPHSIQVFLYDLRQHFKKLNFFYSLLDHNEQQNVNYELIKQKNNNVIQTPERFIITRGLLKQLLMLLFNKPAKEIRFSYESKGKPILACSKTHCHKNSIFPCEFNVSHSKDYAIIALSLQHKIGIDIEHQRKLHHYQQLVSRVLHFQEQEWLKNLSKEQQYQAFFQTWSRKEALSKVNGLGLSLKFSKLCLFQYFFHSSPTLIQVNSDLLWLYDLPVVQNYAAAIAWENCIEDLYCYIC